MLLFNREICFSRPPKCDIVIFDETNSKYIADYILGGLPYYIYEVRPGKIFISPLVIYYFLMSLLSCHWNNQIPKKRKFKFLLSKLFYHYHLCCFELICSKIVITYVDNSGLYHWLCENYSRAEFVAIQNGHSTKNQLKNTTKQYHQHFFCFGEYDKSRYEKFDHTVLNSYPVGSFKLGIYDKYFVKDNKEIYDIGIISQFRPFLLDKQIELFLSFKQFGAHVLSYQVDSLTRNNNYIGAQEEILHSRVYSSSSLNGFPVVNYGPKKLREVISIVKAPLQTRHSTKDPRLLAEISYAGGVTAYEGGAICYNVPYYKNYSLDELVAI